MSRFTPSVAHRTNRVCAAVRICRIRFFRSIAAARQLITGPGQLIGYPIIDLRRCGQDLHRYLRWIENLLIELLADSRIAATTRNGLTGVWVAGRKIASIGVGVRHWITMHGFALNVGGDLSPFDQITPCGIANVAMTSMEKELGTVNRLARSREIRRKKLRNIASPILRVEGNTKR